jgi:hypothetical protein
VRDVQRHAAAADLEYVKRPATTVGQIHRDSIALSRAEKRFADRRAQ